MTTSSQQNDFALASVGIDIGKDVFHLVGFDLDGNIVLRRKIRRSALVNEFEKLPPCIVGMEACLSAHFVSRTLRNLGFEPRKDGDRRARQAARITRRLKNPIAVRRSAWKPLNLEFAATEHIVERAERIGVMTREPRSLDPAEHVRPVDNSFPGLHMHFEFAVVVGHPNLT